MLARPLVHNAPFPAEFSGLYLDGSLDGNTFIGGTINDSVIIAGGSGFYGNERIIGTAPSGISAALVGPDEVAIQGDVGSPTGTFSFILAVDDTVNHWTAFIPVTLVVYPEMAISGTFTGTGQVGVPYSSFIVMSGGDGNYSNPQTDFGAVPSGLELGIDGDHLTLTGTPDTNDSFDFTVTADSGDGQHATSDLQSILITV